MLSVVSILFSSFDTSFESFKYGSKSKDNFDACMKNRCYAIIYPRGGLYEYESNGKNNCRYGRGEI